MFATVSFEGPVAHVYATLIVRLAHSGFFTRDESYRNATVFSQRSSLLGVSMVASDEATGELRLFADTATEAASKRLFLDYVARHAQRRALAETVNVDATVRCGSCGLEVTRDQRALALERGRIQVSCMICDATIEVAGIDLQDEANELVIRKMDASADVERELSAARASLLGKDEVGEFDVFLAHNSGDKSAVRAVAAHLRGFGINPWIDEERIPPGRWFQDVIQRAIGAIPVAAIFIGAGGLGRWETVELRAFISQCVERDIPVIPVLLPHGGIPAKLSFLSEFGWVRFSKSVDEAEPLERLRWGITDPTDARGRPVSGSVPP